MEDHLLSPSFAPQPELGNQCYVMYHFFAIAKRVTVGSVISQCFAIA